MTKGYLALVLHAHLPYVRHPEKEWSLEENWFFEALTETYIPIIKILDELEKDRVDFKITISLSPPLISMMSDYLLMKRYEKRLEQLTELAAKEVQRTAGTEFESPARMYLTRFAEVRYTFVKICNRDLLMRFRRFRESGKVELITSCATHGYLPLMITKESVRAQVSIAVDLFKKYFGSGPRGLWLPECAYTPGVDEILREFGIRFFFTDAHGILYATPRPVNGVYAPVFTPSGVAAFGRDNDASRQVWDKNHGYPGDARYREFYRDIGYDLDVDYIGSYVGENGLRMDTGLKYYRITGSGDKKSVYDHTVAEKIAAEHAGNFMFNREKQVEYLSTVMDHPPVIIAPYDAELFGHWWYEGPRWIDFLLRKIHYDQQTIKTITPLEYLEMFPESQRSVLSASSWGHNGYNEMWLDPSNEWIYRHLNRAETKMVEIAREHRGAQGLTQRALNQMCRELLLAQSSDWAFIMKTGTTVDYSMQRVKAHISRFNRLYWGIKNQDLGETEISNLENLAPIFPDIDYKVYLAESCENTSKAALIPFEKTGPAPAAKRLRILILSWEFPPNMVGGLSRHVFDLSRALASQGLETHVVTCKIPGSGNYELLDGVHVHRVRVFGDETDGFMDWIERLNNSMTNYVSGLAREKTYDLIHAHDWLVASAGINLKNKFRVPLVSTIHATEYGRNHGIHNDVQRKINSIEWNLTYESWRVICCSKYMACEISQVFQLPADKIRIIPNGVEVDNVKLQAQDNSFRDSYASAEEKIVYFVGRLVPEKGVQVLIHAIPMIIEQFSNVKFVISGVGPYRDTLEALAHELGVSHKVYFTGYADDYTRNMLLASSEVAVFPSLYEPFGIVALEAMAANVPVIVSDTGGLSEVIDHGHSGLKVIPNDVGGLAQAILRILREPDLSETLRQGAWRRVNSEYNWGVIAAVTAAVYSEVFEEAFENNFVPVSIRPCS